MSEQKVHVEQTAYGFAVSRGGKVVHSVDAAGGDVWLARKRADAYADDLRKRVDGEPRQRCALGEACDRDRISEQCLAFAPAEKVAAVPLCVGHRKILAGLSHPEFEALAAAASRGPGAPPTPEPGPGVARGGRTRRRPAGGAS